MTKIVVKNTYGYKAYKAQREFWDLRNVPPALDYTEPFYVENITDDYETLSIARLREVSSGTDSCLDITVEYSYNKSVWNTLGTTTHDGAPLTLALNPGDKVYLRASTLRWGPSTNVKIYNNIRGVSKIGGNVMSLLYGSNFTGQEKAFRDTVGFDFYRTFTGNTNLIDAGKLIFPATTLYTRSYVSILSNCPNLTELPILDFVNLGDTSCGWMFENDTSLTKAPKLLPTTLTNGCYYGMFKGCSSLTAAPALPATTLAAACYREMFYGCTSLTTAPALPATTLIANCYYSMFYGCTSLTTAPALPATTLVNYCYYMMFQNCSSLTTAPTLPAITLKSHCYSRMFQGCTHLNEIHAMFTTTPSNSYNSGWVIGVAATGTFYKNKDAKWTTTGNNGVPTGWTIITV